MTDREIDALIAEKVMGRRVSWWSLHSINSMDEIQGLEWRYAVGYKNAIEQGHFPAEVFLADDKGDDPNREMLVLDDWPSPPFYEWVYVQPYSDDIEDACNMEDTIQPEKRGDYLVHLQSLCVPGKFDFASDEHLWAVHRATPRQRCIAALRAYGVAA